MSEAKKFDSGKPMFTSLFTKALAAVIRVMTFGATKYGKFNYLSNGGLEPSRLVDAAMRHTMAWWDGEKKDPESGESHLAHAICCLGMLLEYELRGFTKDDRFREVIEQKNPDERIGCCGSNKGIGDEDGPIKVVTEHETYYESGAYKHIFEPPTAYQIPYPTVVIYGESTVAHPLDYIRKGKVNPNE